MFTPGATYKGRFLTEMTRLELVQALHDTIKECRFMMQFINMKAWHEALQARAEKEMGTNEDNQHLSG